MRTRKSVTFKTNRRPRDPYAASLRMHRAIRFDEKRLALQTLQAWQDLRNWRKGLENVEDDDEGYED